MRLIKKLNYTKKIFRLDGLHWTLPVELDPELRHTRSPPGERKTIGKGCGYSGRKQQQERAASPALNAGLEGAPGQFPAGR